MSEVKHTATADAPELVKFPVFKDHKGNRFVFPGLYASNSRTVSWMRCREICLALNVEQEKQTFDVPIDPDGLLTFSHVTASAGSPGFMHGSSDVYLIGGPEFAAIAAAGDAS